MYYSLLVFEMFFTTSVISRMALIRGWVSGRKAGGGGGGWKSQRRALLATRPQTVVLYPQQKTGMYTNHRIDQDGHWQ